MSLVCFPFKEEDVSVVVRNIELAASHSRVAGVLCVGFGQGATWKAIASNKRAIEESTGKRIIVIQQKRLGVYLRGGKGDGMNTALAFFLEHAEYSRLHFYDADIVSFSGDWMTKAEKQADLGYDVVRHFFPRSSTDAMITWFVTKVGFALLWPNSILPSVEQPLGGELLLSRKAADVLYNDSRVRSQSDWGIDTLYTFAIAQAGLSMFEVYIPEGKVHALYGDLTDLRTMLAECFSAIQSLRAETLESSVGVHRMEYPKPVPELVKQKIGYDVEKTLQLLKSNWTPRQAEMLQQHFDSALVKGLLHAKEWPCWSFADEDAWVAAYSVFLDKFVKDDSDWEELLFKVWVARVLNHTLRHVLRGYDTALGTLREFVADVQHQAALRARAASVATSHTIMSGHTAAEGLANGKLPRRKQAWNNPESLCSVPV